MEKHVYKAYDIRGIYGKEITAEDAVKVGAGFASFVGGKKFVVGYDARACSPILAKAVVAGMVACGAHVKEIGISSTPEVFFASHTLGVDGGISVSASHNPPEYCGFKFARPDGTEYFDEELSRLYKGIEGWAVKGTAWNKAGSSEETSMREAYVQNIVRQIPQGKKLKIVVDVMNGCGGVGGEILRQLGHSVEMLNGEPDGSFGGRTPEPKAETLKELSAEVKRRGAVFGCAFDGDADRCVFLDETGKILRAEAVMMLMARHEFSRGGEKTVVATVNCSQKLEDFVKKLGGRVIWSRIGRVYIEQLVVKSGAAIAGEESSHFWFPKVYPFSDGPLAAAKFAEMAAELKKPLSEEVRALGLGVEAKGRVVVAEEKKWKAMDAITAKLKKEGRFIDVDGIKLVKDDYWVIVRASNTEPIIRINVEAKSEKQAELVLTKYKKTAEETASAV